MASIIHSIEVPVTLFTAQQQSRPHYSTSTRQNGLYKPVFKHYNAVTYKTTDLWNPSRFPQNDSCNYALFSCHDTMMPLHMFRKTCPLAESHWAQLTHKALFTCMQTGMIYQGTLLSETCWAVLTSKGTLACVGTHVGAQVTFLIEASIAHVASIRLYTRVGVQVGLQVAAVLKSPGTNGTYIRGLACMLTTMGYEVHLACKCSWTYITRIRSFSHVTNLVLPKALPTREGCWTLGALESLWNGEFKCCEETEK